MEKSNNQETLRVRYEFSNSETDDERLHQIYEILLPLSAIVELAKSLGGSQSKT